MTRRPRWKGASPAMAAKRVRSLDRLGELAGGLTPERVRVLETWLSDEQRREGDAPSSGAPSSEAKP